MATEPEAAITVRKGTWEAIQEALKDKGHPPVLVFARRSDYGQGTTENLVAAAQRLMQEQGSPTTPIVFSSCDPRIFEANGKVLNEKGMGQAFGVAFVFKNGGAPVPSPYPQPF